jgi:uncharacterized lipoprotein NlpE involved in copper resistance
MQTKIKAILGFSLLLGAVSTINPAFAETPAAEHADTHNHAAEENFEWPGIYTGFIPCADCIGVKTTLALNKNGSYILMTQFVGKSEREFVEKGKFAFNKTSNTIVLTPRNSTTANSQQYLIGENSLIQLDNSGNKVTGKLAERYILRNSDITSNPPSHSGHH